MTARGDGQALWASADLARAYADVRSDLARYEAHCRSAVPTPAVEALDFFVFDRAAES